MFCQKCGSAIPDGAHICPACGTAEGQSAQAQQPVYTQAQPQYQAYSVPKAKTPMRTEKLFASIFKKISWVTLLTFILGCAATFLSFVSMFTSIFHGFFVSNLISGLKDTVLCAMITILATIVLAKIDNKDE